MLARRAAAYRALLYMLDPSPRMELMLRFIDDASTDSRVSADEEGLASAALASEVECHLNRFAYDPLYAIFLDQMGAQAHPGTRRDPESGLGFEPHGDSEAVAKANRKRLSAPFDADGVELWYASASTGQLRHVAPLGRDPDAEEEAESERWTAERIGVGVAPVWWTLILSPNLPISMPRTRPPYPAEFRDQLVALHHAGRSVDALAEEFEPTRQTIQNWIAASQEPSGLSIQDLPSDQEELRRLRKEVKRLQLERDILAKAAAWFARETGSVPAGRSSSPPV